MDAASGARPAASGEEPDSLGPPIRLAATVLLVRDSPVGVQVYLQLRAAAMAFAGGMIAFPGGAVDPGDAAALPPARLAEVATSFDCDVPTADAVLGAAVREVAEETTLTLDAASLHPWARWLTPPGQSRRYDTFFLLTAAADDQQARAATAETAADFWERPADALAAARAGRWAMLPPTVAMLESIAVQHDVAQILAERPAVALLEPEVISAPGDPIVVRAGDRDYPAFPAG